MKKSLIFLVALGCIITVFAIIHAQKTNVNQSILIDSGLVGSFDIHNNYTTRLSSLQQFSMTIPDGFVLQAETSNLTLYLERQTMAIAVKDKRNGYLYTSYDPLNPDLATYSQDMYKSYKSGLSIQTYNSDVTVNHSLLDTGVTLTYTTIENGFSVVVDFTIQQIRMTVNVLLDQNDLVVDIPNDQIEEYNPDLWVVGNDNISLKNIVVYPFFGSTAAENNGYVVIPDGTGALVDLATQPKYKMSYRSPIYGEDMGYQIINEPSGLNVETTKDLARVTLPIFGMIHDVGNAGFLAISEQGANYATYNYEAKGLSTNYYQSFFEYNYRLAYKQYQSRVDKTKMILGFQTTLNQVNLKERYRFLSGADANYVGVAKSYRNYLENNNGFTQLSPQHDTFPTHITMIGNEVEQGIFFQKNVTATTYKGAENIVNTLQSDGVTTLNVTFKTYNIGGDGYLFDVYNNLGGAKSFQHMVRDFKDEGVEFNYYVDYLDRTQQSSHTASKLNKSALQTLNYSYMFPYLYINQVKYLPSEVKNDIQDFNHYGIDSISLDGLQNGVYTQKYKGNVISSDVNMATIKQALGQLSDKQMTVNLYNPDAYLYPYTTNHFETPLSSSELMLADATIPLLQLVISGHMEQYTAPLNFMSDDVNILLRMVEYGINPSYLLTQKDTYDLKYTNSSDVYISQYASLKNRILANQNFISKGLTASDGQELINHTFIADGVTLSEFSDGHKIIVNYTNQDYNYLGTIIKAKDYDVL